MTREGNGEAARRVRRQYEGYPYPHRDPEQERLRLIETHLDGLDRVNHYCFGGRRNFADGFRALVAGGGTGDATIYLAEQLRDTPTAVVYLDVSEASMAVAKRRAEARGLENITWLLGSLLDLPEMSLERFDYVNCTGVLHHLADPAAGLGALRAVLRDDGAMGLMVYGQYGRTGIYQMQELMRRLVTEADDDHDRIALTREVLARLPSTNWFRRAAELVPGNWRDDDAELYDLLLHCQDRAYTVEQLHELLDGCGLHLIEFIPHERARYQPELFIRDEALLEQVGRMPLRERQAIGELLSGAIMTHQFHAAPRTDTVARVDDLEMAPLLPVSMGEAVNQPVWTLSAPGMPTLTVRPGRYAQAAFGLIDGRRSLREVFDLVSRQFPEHPGRDEVMAQFRPVYEALNGWGDAVLLRRPAGGR